MRTYLYPQPSNWASILARPLIQKLEMDQIVETVMKAVQQDGDSALQKYTQQFDKVNIENFEVPLAEKEQAEAQLSDPLKQAINTAIENIQKFHQSQEIKEPVIETMPGVKCWRQSKAIDKVGFYIPGGSAPLFSTVLMLGVPAAIAGCKERILCSPPQADGKLHPAILYAAQQVGIKRIFKVGGIQAIAAMTYGTESVPAVYKIFGPGNQYVDAAKQFVSRIGVAIDLPAGPSEVLVYADQTTPPAFIASDLLAQAEHGPDSQVIFVTLDADFAKTVAAEVSDQLATLPRRAIATQALEHSKIVVLNNHEQALQFINAYAPEHLILADQNALETAQAITNAGSVFIGPYTPESVGDYASGTNHTLPTNGFARAYSGVSLDAFVKKITYQQLTETGLKNIGPAVELLAEAESLEAHKRAVSIRLKNLNPS
jgi:histidinol dehydrogenase